MIPGSQPWFQALAVWMVLPGWVGCIASAAGLERRTLGRRRRARQSLTVRSRMVSPNTAPRTMPAMAPLLRPGEEEEEVVGEQVREVEATRAKWQLLWLATPPVEASTTDVRREAEAGRDGSHW